MGGPTRISERTRTLSRIGAGNRIATLHPNGRFLLWGAFVPLGGCLHSNRSAIDLVEDYRRELTFDQWDSDPFYYRA